MPMTTHLPLADRAGGAPAAGAVRAAALADRAPRAAVSRRARASGSGWTRSPGLKPNDLNSINGLNHYIGMKAIEPGRIPELRFMP